LKTKEAARYGFFFSMNHQVKAQLGEQRYSYQNVLDRGLLLTVNLLQRVPLGLVEFFETFMVATMTWLTGIEYVCHT
jgi:hypothetical protein